MLLSSRATGGVGAGLLGWGSQFCASHEEEACLRKLPCVSGMVWQRQSPDQNHYSSLLPLRISHMDSMSAAMPGAALGSEVPR